MTIASVIVFIIGLVLFFIVACTLWWIIFGLAAPLWAKCPAPSAITWAKVLFALLILLCFVLWLTNGMPLPFGSHRLVG